MINERFCPLSVNREFFVYQHFVIIRANGTIPSHIAVNPAENDGCGTIQHTERLNIGYRCHIVRLARMPGNSVQNEHITVAATKSGSIQKQGNDFYCKRKVLVLEQEALFENAMDEIEFLGREVGGLSAVGNGSAEL